MEVLNRLYRILNIKPRGGTPKIPPVLVLNANLRGGLSANRVSSIAFEREKEILSTDEPHRAMYKIIIEEIIKEIQENAIIEVAIPPSTAISISQGANAGGPIIVQGTVTNILSGTGVMR